MLFPKSSAHRMLFQLDGLWNFSIKSDSEDDLMVMEEVRAMPVPSAYNDLYTEQALRDYVGDVIYERTFEINKAMLQDRLVLRFGSVTHHARVYVNGKKVVEHKGGFLPFEIDIAQACKIGSNTLRVIVDNRLDFTTLPVGRLQQTNYPGYGEVLENLPNFDFFNYAGIMRPVYLYTTAKTYVDSIDVRGDMHGKVHYKLDIVGNPTDVQIRVRDEEGQIIQTLYETEGTFTIEEPKLWQPLQAYLYDMEILIQSEVGDDQYTQAFGLRSVEVKENKFLINGKPFYFKGFGKHEDSNLRGRGFDMPLNVRDMALLKWVGANSFRTSHYPYSEEMMIFCEREGIVLIDEVPAVGMHTKFTATGLLGGTEGANTWETLETSEHHEQVIRDLIARDKNYCCVVMWSIANEPASEEEGAYAYFKPLYNLAKEQDPQSRPVTIVTYGGATVNNCEVSEMVDVLALNRYNAWYSQSGNIAIGVAVLEEELKAWHAKYPDKPMMFCEYGADTVIGMSALPSTMFTEGYQTEFLEKYHALFDTFDWFIGEHIWNFADFGTAQNTMRVNGNKKGVFTRERQPKMAAYNLRERWLKIPDFGYKG